MKRIIALVLVFLFAFASLNLVACGNINQNNVAVLWAGDGEVKVPDSLINCLERSMYIEKIGYEHYGAKGKADTQYDQAKTAVEANAAALVVELVNSLDAQKFVDLAKSKNIPIVFVNCAVVSDVLASYEKCALVASDITTVAATQGEQIAKYVKDNFKNIDRNGDGKISYVAYTVGLTAAQSAEAANKLLTADEDYKLDKEGKRTELVFYDAKNIFKVLPALGAGISQAEIMEKYNDESENTVELIITDSDYVAFDVLVALQENGFNTDKLTTHCIPMFTVGFEMDYKTAVLKGAPDKDADKYFEDAKYLCDLTVVAEEDRDEMIWNTKNVIGAGRIAGTVIEDQDGITGAVAVILRNLIKGNETFKDLDSDNVKSKTYLVPYIAN